MLSFTAGTMQIYEYKRMRRVLLWALLSACSGCATAAAPVEIRLGEERISVDGIGRCDDRPGGPVTLNPDTPLAVFVHGCDSSGGRFRSMAGVFEAAGRQALCFNYDDRERVEDSAQKLASALSRIEAHHRHPEMTVIGHSQGGLVSRRALVERRGDLIGDGARYRLVTVSSPFNGIAASRHCGQTARHILTLGISAGLCRAVAGSKWREIHPGSEMVRHPGTLTPQVVEVLKVVTDERGTCRRFDDSGRCEEDDFVFSLEEQYNRRVDDDPRVVNVEVDAGHVEIVGDSGTVPTKLIRVLREHRILPELQADTAGTFARLVARIYGVTGLEGDPRAALRSARPSSDGG